MKKSAERTPQEKLSAGEVLMGADALAVAKDVLAGAGKLRHNGSAARELAECIAQAERRLKEDDA
jgi:hypothetical protein